MVATSASTGSGPKKLLTMEVRSTTGAPLVRGATMPDGLPEEFDEDASFAIQDLSQVSER